MRLTRATHRVTSYTPAIGAAMKKRALAVASKFQKLSCREGGQFDKKFHAMPDANGNVVRGILTRWDRVCRQRAAARTAGGA